MAFIAKRTYVHTKPDGTTVKKKTAHYSIRVVVNGRRKWVKGYTDLGATRQLAAKLEAAAARGEQLMVDPFKRFRHVPLKDHLKSFLGDLRAMGRDAVYVYVTDCRLTRLFSDAGWTVYDDITSDSFTVWRHRRATDRDKPVSATTLNQWLNAGRSFCNWMMKQKRAGSNPLQHVDRVTGDAVRVRRALTDEQVTAVIEAAPPARRLAWELLVMTGLRVQEATDLEWQDVKIDAPRPFLRLRAGKTKSRKEQIVSLRVDLADQLRELRPKAFRDTDPVFRSFPTLAAWKIDLAAAGVPYRDDAGRAADRHALRHTLATRLQRAGVPPRVAMELMRHSDMRLTMKVYTDPALFNLADALESLPSVRKNEEPKGTAQGTVRDTVDPKKRLG